MLVRGEIGDAAEALFGSARGPGARMSAAERLAGLLEPAALFHAPDGRAYAMVEAGEHCETWPVRSKRFRGWLGHAYYAATKKPAPGQAMSETLALAEAR